MTITITPAHILKGHRNNCRWCPAALALKDAGFKRVEVSPLTLQLDWQDYDIPTKLHFWVARFDRGEKVKPMTFELDETP